VGIKGKEGNLPGVASNSIKSAPNFMYDTTSVKVMMTSSLLERICNGIMAEDHHPPHDFEHASRSYYTAQKDESMNLE
jgi:hypothetical protein